MPLRDFYCTACGATIADVLARMDEVHMVLPCRGCNANREHGAVCTGGTGTRFRQQDWPDDERFYRGQVTASAPQVTEIDDKTKQERPTRHSRLPVAMHDLPRYSADARAERRDRLHHAQDRRNGRTPIRIGARR